MRKYTLHRIFVLAVVVLVCCCCLPFGFSYWLNSKRLQRFADSLYDYPLPPETEIVDRQAQVAVLTGAGNHCDYLARQILIAKLTREEIEAYYRDVRPPSVGSGELNYIKLLFDEMSLPDGQLRFTIEAYDTNYDAGFDIRCW